MLEKLKNIFLQPLSFPHTNTRLIRGINEGNVLVLMLHRVLPKNQKSKFWMNNDLEVTPDFLEAAIILAKENGFNPISFDELIGTELRAKEKYILFSFDDGYKDNLTNALPIFEKHKVPFCIYCTTKIIDHDFIFWWYELENLILSCEVLNTAHNGRLKTYECHEFDVKQHLFLKLREEAILLDERQRQEFLAKLFELNDRIMGFGTKDISLSWQDLQSLSRHPLVSIGAHTVNHLSLADLSPEQAFAEMLDSKEIIEDKISSEVKHFCYPFGSHSNADKREYGLAKRAGYASATTTIEDLYSVNSEYTVSYTHLTLPTTERV